MLDWQVNRSSDGSHSKLRATRPNYGVNVINHLIWESEVLKFFHKDAPNQFGTPEIQAAKANLSRQMRTVSNAFTNAHMAR